MTLSEDFLSELSPVVVLDELDRIDAEASLYEFVRQAWSSIDSTAFQENWHIEALCAHLEAVTRGEIRFLLVNLPPRCAKSLVTSVCWPVWAWLQKERSTTSGPGVRFLCASYGTSLTLQNADKMRDLIRSPWLQKHWGMRIGIRPDKDVKSDFSNFDGGGRQSTSIGGALLGMGGDVIVVDDPHNTEGVESEAERENALRGWRELSGTRMNDPQKSAIVVIMQRLHEEDVSGVILEEESERLGRGLSPEWTHLMIPMRYDLGRHCETDLGWSDPRAESAEELMWPERFDEDAVQREEDKLGPYMASGRLQQSPEPAGGGIIKTEWWKPWEQDTFPAFTYTLVSVDTAFTEKAENDWTACTVWGLWKGGGYVRLMLMEAWRIRKPLHSDDAGLRRQDEEIQDYWERLGVVERILDTARRRKADRILIEQEARGIDAANEVKRLMRAGEFVVETFLAGKHGDKVARLYAAQPLFAGGLVYAPDRSWSDMVITEVSQVPKGKHDDLADTVSQALIWLRSNGLLELKGEQDAEAEREKTFRPEGETISDHYGA